MPTTTRNVRVFVSSTFEDLKEERNILQADVFPALEKFCLEKGARFQAIDLPWGVRKEAGLDQKTMEIRPSVSPNRPQQSPLHDHLLPRSLSE